MAGDPPQYKQEYDPRPKPGYNRDASYQQGNAQPAYGQPAYGQPPYYPMYMPVGVPPKKDNTAMIVAVVVVVVVMLVIIVPVAMAFFMMQSVSNQMQSMEVETPLGTRVEKSVNNDWIVYITSGSDKSYSSLYVQVVNATTGRNSVNTQISLGPTSDFQYNDNDGDSRLSAGDTILLKGSSPNIRSGDRFQLVKSDDVIATRTLP